MCRWESPTLRRAVAARLAYVSPAALAALAQTSTAWADAARRTPPLVHVYGFESHPGDDDDNTSVAVASRGPVVPPWLSYWGFHVSCAGALTLACDDSTVRVSLLAPACVEAAPRMRRRTDRQQHAGPPSNTAWAVRKHAGRRSLDALRAAVLRDARAVSYDADDLAAAPLACDVLPAALVEAIARHVRESWPDTTSARRRPPAWLDEACAGGLLANDVDDVDDDDDDDATGGGATKEEDPRDVPLRSRLRLAAMHFSPTSRLFFYGLAPPATLAALRAIGDRSALHLGGTTTTTTAPRVGGPRGSTAAAQRVAADPADDLDALDDDVDRVRIEALVRRVGCSAPLAGVALDLVWGRPWDDAGSLLDRAARIVAELRRVGARRSSSSTSLDLP